MPKSFRSIDAGWLVRNAAAAVVLAGLTRYLAGTELFAKTLVGTSRVSASIVTQIVGYGLAILFCSLIVMRTALTLRTLGPRAAAVSTVVIPAMLLGVLLWLGQFLGPVIRSLWGPDLESQYNGLSVAVICLCALWLCVAVVRGKWATPFLGLSRADHSLPATMLAMQQGASEGSTARLSARWLDPAGQPSPVQSARIPPPWFFALLRRFWPIARFGRWVIVSRFDDVEEALARSDVLKVPWTSHIKRLNDGEEPGTNFILGIDDGSEHDHMLRQVLSHFRHDDVGPAVAAQSSATASEIISQSGGELEVVFGLFSKVATRVCEEYFGLSIPNHVEFARWTMSVSGFLFGPPNPSDTREATVEFAANQIRDVVNSSINRALSERSKGESPHRETVLDRLVTSHLAGALPAETIRSFLMDMVLGFVPTNTIANSNILEMLLSHPKMMSATQDAARSGDGFLLKRCLFEALRFQPINPGPLRVCAQSFTLAAGSSRARTIKEGSIVLCSTMSAMFDPRRVHRPSEFNPLRAANEYLHFGHGLHVCSGAAMAEAQVTQIFIQLLRADNIRRLPGSAGRLLRNGLFPERLNIKLEKIG